MWSNQSIKGCLAAGSITLINDFFETLKIIGNYDICNNLEFQDLTNEIENLLAELEKEEQEKDDVIFRLLDYELLEIEERLSFNRRERDYMWKLQRERKCWKQRNC